MTVVDPKAELAFKNISRMMEIHGLSGYLREIRLKTADRFFFRASLAIQAEMLKRRFRSSKSSGGPHRMVYQVFREVEGWGSQYSFRSMERPSLQVTIAFSGGFFYGDADLDLGNPLMDVVGFVTHGVELLIPGKTSHEKLERKVSRRFEEWKSRQKEER